LVRGDPEGLKPGFFFEIYAALKRRSSTVLWGSAVIGVRSPSWNSVDISCGVRGAGEVDFPSWGDLEGLKPGCFFELYAALKRRSFHGGAGVRGDWGAFPGVECD
jgi:hypothetical protein